MKLDNIQQLLYDELSDVDLSSNTIMINGDWGIGKTYCIYDSFFKFIDTYSGKEEFNKSEIAEIKNKYNIDVIKKNLLEGMLAIKVSLFGKKSIEQINQELIIDLDLMSKLGRNAYKAVNTILGSVKFNGFSVKLPDLSFIAEKLYKGIKGKAEQGKRILIFFDDLERINDDKFLVDVLGYIENLSTKSGVNIIIACNEDKLLQNEKYKEYKEKVVDLSFSFDKPSQKSIDSFLSDYKEYHNENLYDYIVNLRTLQKTKKKLLPILNRVKGMENEKAIINEIFVRLYFCMLESEEGYFTKLSDEKKEKEGDKGDGFSRLNNEPIQLLEEAAGVCADLMLHDSWYNEINIIKQIFDYINDKNELEKLVSYVDLEIEKSKESKISPDNMNDKDKTKYFQNLYEQMLKSDKAIEIMENLCEANHWVDKYCLPIEIDKELLMNKIIDGLKGISIDTMKNIFDECDILNDFETQRELVDEIKKRAWEAVIKSNFEKMVNYYNEKNYYKLHVDFYKMTKNNDETIPGLDKILKDNNLFFSLEHNMAITINHRHLIGSIFRYLYNSKNKELLLEYIQKFEEFVKDKNADNTDKIRTKELLDALAMKIANTNIHSLKASLAK
ncbi:MAG: KAP family NTPase [Firmicutes bacterium]|nr:KAP family NTPase [Bacillota bacterium]